MALCYIVVACNGTRDNIYGVYPTHDAAWARMKELFADQPDDYASDSEIQGFGGKIVEIADGGEALDVEIHGTW